MPKRGERRSAPPGWVDVTDEAYHEETFRNERIRVYVARIPPGVETAYHRHDKNTLYVVLHGGRNTTHTLPGTRGTNYVFPRSIGLKRKVKWGLTRLFFGWTYLPKSVYFLMDNSRNRIIHKVRAADDNPGAMELMGIEFLEPAAGHPGTTMGEKPLRPDYEADGLCVLRARLPADLPHLKESLCFTGLVVLLKGALAIEASAPGTSDRIHHELKEGDFLWNDGTDRLALGAPRGQESEFLIVLIK